MSSSSDDLAASLRSMGALAVAGPYIEEGQWLVARDRVQRVEHVGTKAFTVTDGSMHPRGAAVEFTVIPPGLIHRLSRAQAVHPGPAAAPAAAHPVPGPVPDVFGVPAPTAPASVGAAPATAPATTSGTASGKASGKASGTVPAPVEPDYLLDPFRVA